MILNTHIFVILILLSLVPKNVGNDENGANVECKYKPCGSTPHTMCKYPAVLDKSKSSCKAPESKGGLTTEQRRGLLDSHNRNRQMIAQGRAKGQPKAANMMKLRWNFELEEMAQRFLNSCPDTTAHDTCRNMLSGMSVGQNSAWGPFKYKIFPGNRDLGAMAVKIWYDEVKDMKLNYIEDITTASDDEFKKIGHYSQIAWAASEELGCGYISREHEDAVYQYYTCNCNYAPAGNVMVKGTEIYKMGEPCSQCPENTRCSQRYPGLCTAEKDEYNDISNVSTTEAAPHHKRHRHGRRSAAGALYPRLSTRVFSLVFSTLVYFNLN